MRWFSFGTLLFFLFARTPLNFKSSDSMDEQNALDEFIQSWCLLLSFKNVVFFLETAIKIEFNRRIQMAINWLSWSKTPQNVCSTQTRPCFNAQNKNKNNNNNNNDNKKTHAQTKTISIWLGLCGILIGCGKCRKTMVKWIKTEKFRT